MNDPLLVSERKRLPSGRQFSANAVGGTREILDSVSLNSTYYRGAEIDAISVARYCHAKVQRGRDTIPLSGREMIE